MQRVISIPDGEGSRLILVDLPATMREVFEYQALILAYADGSASEANEWRQLAREWATRYAPKLGDVSDKVLAEVCGVICALSRPPQWVLDDLKARMMLDKELTKDDELDDFDSAFAGAHISVSSAAQVAYSASSADTPSLDLSPWEFEYARIASLIRAMKWGKDDRKKKNVEETHAIAARHGLPTLQ